MNDLAPLPSGELLLYTSSDGNVRLELNIQEDTIWMTQQMMADLFQTSVQNVGQHIVSILQDLELQEDGTIKKFFIVRQEDNRQVKRSIAFYNLDMVISVGYRVNSVRGTQFRIFEQHQRINTEQQAENNYVKELEAHAKSSKKDSR